MAYKENKIVRVPDSCSIQMKTECVRVDLRGTKSKGYQFQTRKKTDAMITASYDEDLFSIRDTASNVLLAITLEDAVNAIAAAVEAEKENECKEKTSDTAEAAENA